MATVIESADLPELSTEELSRYARHLSLPEVGTEGQRKLKAARVLCVGTGGLGSPLAFYLAAAGIGTLGLVDFDVVDASNLQRQIIHSTKDIGRKKLDSAAEKLTALNPALNVVKHETMLSSSNALEILKDYDIIADGTDNFPTRYLVNDACVLLKKPNVYGSIYRFEGQVSVFDASRGPCYRCLYSQPPPPGLVPSCAEGGVLGLLPGLVGTLQGVEVVKLLLGKGEPLIGRLLLVDALGTTFRELKIRKDPDCVLCGPHATQKSLVDYQEFCGLGTPTILPPELEIEPEDLKSLLDQSAPITLVDVREPGEYEICRLPGSKLIPRNSLAERLGELSTSEDVVVYCKVGGRSADAVKFLQTMGFTKVRTLKGGLDAWAQRVDPSMPTY